jgi:thioredoxin reductase
MSQEEQDHTYDVVVVGGGAAGLSGALALGRSRRSVLVIDAGEPRNRPAEHVHNYLGREGTPPTALLVIGRAEVQQYGVRVERATVLDAKRRGPHFELQRSDGRAVRARRILLATGLTDRLPELPGVADGWGSTVLHCPYCHGWEVRDQAVGVLGTGPMAVHQTLMFRNLSSDVVLFSHTAPALTPDAVEQLDALSVEVITERVAGWESGGVRLRTGELVPRQVLVVSPVFEPRFELLESLGLRLEPVEIDGHIVGSQVPTDPTGRTAVDGVWAAGNVANIHAQVISSAAVGLVAGAAINADLIAEDTRLAVERTREAAAKPAS